MYVFSENVCFKVKGKAVLSTLVMDDDTTVMPHLREICPELKKASDREHVMKNFSKELFSLAKSYKVTTSVVYYFQKLFQVIGHDSFLDFNVVPKYTLKMSSTRGCRMEVWNGSM